jgi:hypothetical protein
LVLNCIKGKHFGTLSHKLQDYFAESCTPKPIKMKLFVTLLALATVLVIDAQVSMHNPNYCYTADPIRPQNGMHSTQSSYEAIRRPAIDPNVSCKLKV